MKPSKTEFLKRVKGFKLTVHKDDGLYRHLTIKHPDNSFDSFNIMTWPGYLSYNGDMGDFTFSRLNDMFQFFRGKGPNPDYWYEKLQAVDRHGGYEEFSIDKFNETVKYEFNEYWEFENNKQKKESWQEIEWDLLNRPESNEYAHSLGHDYKCSVTGQEFIDFWEHDFNDYTYRFIYCCRAIPYAIEKYDKWKLKNG